MPTQENQKNIRQVILAALAFGLAIGAFFYWKTGSAYYGFHGGFFGGFLFGLAIKTFLKVSMSTPHLEIDGREAGFDDDETVIHFGPANHFKGIESVGGKLFLTNKRLRFRSHKLNFQTHDESFPLDAIRAAERAMTIGIVPNGLLVHMHDGTRERFVVSGRSEWVTKIRETAGKGSSRSTGGRSDGTLQE